MEVRELPATIVEAHTSQRSAIAERYATQLQEIQDKTGQAPSLKTYQDILMNPGARLTEQDYSHIKAKFISLQRPRLSLEEIRVLHAALRDNIKSLHASWSVTYKGAESVEGWVPGKFEFWMNSNGLRYDRTYGVDTAFPIAHYRRSYKGRLETVYESSNNTSHAVIHPLIDTSYYYDEQNPLWLAKLLNSQRDLGSARGGLENLQERYAYPLEEEVLFHGTSCIPLLEGDTVYYLDPSRNYAYRGMIAGGYAFSRDAGRLIEAPMRGVHFIEQMQDCGEGLWLPIRSIEKRYYTDRPPVEITVDVGRLEVNKIIDPKVFAEIVSTGVEVIDGTPGVAVIQIQSKSVGETVGQVPTHRNGGGWERILLGLNAILVVIAVAFWTGRTALRKGRRIQ